MNYILSALSFPCLNNYPYPPPPPHFPKTLCPSPLFPPLLIYLLGVAKTLPNMCLAESCRISVLLLKSQISLQMLSWSLFLSSKRATLKSSLLNLKIAQGGLQLVIHVILICRMCQLLLDWEIGLCLPYTCFTRTCCTS